MTLVSIAGDRAPYSFVFAGIVLACLLAGWRSGLLALILGQILTWIFVAGPLPTGNPENARLAGLLLSTSAEAMILVVIALYQREVDRYSTEREQHLDLLGEALAEIDHRTKNNYQTVLALIQLQAGRSREPEVKAALQQVADRIQAINLATEHLALRSDNLDTVRLGDHLRQLCKQVERGLSRDGVDVECEVANLTVSSEKAVYLSIIVNELVTNALKHAFEGRDHGVIKIGSTANGKGVCIVVADDGCGLSGAKTRSGMGTRLVDRFVRQLGAKHEVTSSASGTVHRIIVPTLN
jgi:two-component sensor histidine kinase